MARALWPAGVLSSAIVLVAVSVLIGWPRASQVGPPRQWHVRAGSSGDGTAARPFGRVSDALTAAVPGEDVLIHPGTYRERILTVRGGTATTPLIVRAARADRPPLFETSGRVATIAHPFVVLDGLVLDGGYGNDDAVRVTSAATGLVLRNLEVRRTSHDCVDMASPSDVLVERVLIHHCLNAAGGRKDAHGIVTSAVERLTIRDTEIHTFSGDALQFDPARVSPGWTDVRLERLKLWLAPLDAPTNGFPAGVVPGENAIDTKTPREGRRSALKVDQVEAWGFRNGLMSNMAAFNVKERVDAVFSRVTVHHSAIGFRLRGPADRGAAVTIRGTVFHHVDTGVRYEDDVAVLRVEDSTFGRNVTAPFRRVASPATRPEVRGLLVLGTSLPTEAGGRGRVVGAGAFVDAGKDDYRLTTADPPRR